MGKKLSYGLYRFIRFMVWVFYPKTRIVGTENIPDGPVVAVGNHAKMNAPIATELYFPAPRTVWTIGEMMHVKEVPAYAFKDFWSKKPVYIRWFFKILSYIIAPFAACIFTNCDCIGVYHDSRVMKTFKQSMNALHDGVHVIILPEQDVAHNNIVCEFQEGFVDLAGMYYRKYKEDISFIPMYTAPAFKAIYLGKPVKFNHEAPLDQERVRISQAMMDSITEIARDLPEHTVVPYPNIPKKMYPTNKMTDMIFDSNGLRKR